ncbi:MAG: MBL fold metallo-hydrolase [Verrucomicrobiales bacterium]|nr:MBL fold metallo-hydrolase [Verrucomicrobiales bacterium]
MRFHLHLIILAFAFSATSCANRLDTQKELLVGTKATPLTTPRNNDVQITYLGTNGYLIRSSDTSIVIDPFFSRISLAKVIFNTPYSPSASLIAKYTQAAQFPSRIDAWLITHSHFDHLIDVPPLQQQFGGKIITSTTGKFLCLAAADDIPAQDIIASQAGNSYTIGNARIHVLPSIHDRVLGDIPIAGQISKPLTSEPTRPRDWKVGKTLAFLIEISGKKIYIDCGGLSGHPPQAHDVDLAILGAAVGDGQRRFAEAVRTLNPRYILPSHQDNFFTPLKRGFRFSFTSNFPQLKKNYLNEQLPGELILMDYFHSWMLN